MKTHHIPRLLPMIFLAAAITSCQLPPRYAMREIQSKGLFNYLSSDYSTVSPSNYASAAPFQLQRPYAEPRPSYPIPYRSTYQTNRNLKADYNRVPYRPESASRPSPVPSKKSTRVTSRDDIVKIEPTLPPSLTKTSQGTSKEAPTPGVTKIPAESLPYGAPVSGRPGMVTSPFALKHQLVDVSGLAPGDAVKDPYSGKLFRVPPTQQAADKPKETPEPPPTPEPKADPKPAAPAEEPSAGAAKPEPKP